MFQEFTPVADRSFGKKHCQKLRQVLQKTNLDGFIVPHDDEYLNEYTPAYADRLKWVSGFTGSAGLAVVLIDKAALFIDGRYTIQARDEVDPDVFSFHDIIDEPPHAWLREAAPLGGRIGFDPKLHTISALKKFEKAAEAAGFKLVPTPENPVDVAWDDQPPRPSAAIFVHPAELTGLTVTEKLSTIADELRGQSADAAIISAPASVAWLFNIRGGDVQRTPVPLGRAIVHSSGDAALYVSPEKLSSEIEDALDGIAKLRPEETFENDIKGLGAQKRRVLLDPDNAPAHFFYLVEAAGGTIVSAPDPCVFPKARKTNAEQNGARTAHLKDGIALTRFLHWLDTETSTQTIDEIAATKKLEEFRRVSSDLTDISFDTIAGSGPHGAIVHYRVTTKTNRSLQTGELFLVDSGGQYPDGTTDVTRTVAIGAPSAEMRDRFTRVLKGHISLATAKFPTGTTGAQLDALARRPLWDIGLDYDHGTGHGVGSYLGVHEGPQRIAKAPNTVALEPGMIISNEPGYYKSDAYGIRIENLVLVRPANIPDAERSMLEFETLTLAPIDRSLIDKALLDAAERDWLNQYQQRVRETLTPHLPDDVSIWLEEQTEAI
ncbi:MAG: aminopeptidase P family protein [Pseudomonadota bacterium]